MANKKTKASGKGGKTNKQNSGKGSQVTRGPGKGTVQQSPATTQKVNLSSRFAIKNNGTDGDVTVTGSEIIGVANNAASGKIIFIADLNPVTWASSRVARMLPLFETYLITSLRVTYIPSCSTTTGGLLYMYYDRDPNDPPIGDVSDPTNLSRLMSNQGAVAGQAWKPLTMSYTRGPSDLRGYYSAPVNDSGDLRLTSQGMVYAYSSASNGALSGGLFKFDYVIKLMSPTGAPLAKTSLTPWTYTNFTNGALGTTTPYNPGMSAWGYVMGGVTEALENIVECIVDSPQSINLGNSLKNISAYTPIYFRQLVNVGWVTYLSLSSAIAGGTDYAYNANVAISAFGWVRILVNLASNYRQEN